LGGALMKSWPENAVKTVNLPKEALINSVFLEPGADFFGFVASNSRF
jgi:hypothetical protein